jgi:pimeloyl-ACP methyl ester carboxylesterase
METFRIMAEKLVTYGYDVLTFDLFGFGLSDSPHKMFKPKLFAAQILELLSLLGYPEGYRFSLVGFSMGGVVAAELASKHPRRIRRLLLVAPAGLVKMGRSERFGVKGLRLARKLKIPVASWLGSALFRKISLVDFEPDIRDEELCQQLGEKNHRAFLSDPKKYSKAWLKSVRDMRLGDGQKLYKRLADSGVELMFMWGDSDEVVPLWEIQDELRDFFPTTPVMLLEGAGHGLLSCPNHSAVVTSSAARWFSRASLPEAQGASYLWTADDQ